jgi:hypothetical protein
VSKSPDALVRAKQAAKACNMTWNRHSNPELVQQRRSFDGKRIRLATYAATSSTKRDGASRNADLEFDLLYRLISSVEIWTRYWRIEQHPSKTQCKKSNRTSFRTRGYGRRPHVENHIFKHLWKFLGTLLHREARKRKDTGQLSLVTV